MNSLPAILLLTVAFLPALLMTSCTGVKTSRYAAYNHFEYKDQQPRFWFYNDSLQTETSWWWATAMRVTPQFDWLPKEARRIIRAEKRPGERLLFAGWTPRRKKYHVAGLVPVTKKDVRFVDENNTPHYLAVLIKEGAAMPDTTVFAPEGRSNDYQFLLYSRPQRRAGKQFMVHDILAVHAFRPGPVYHFISVMDTVYFGNTGAFGFGQHRQFIEDARRLTDNVE